MRSRQAFVVLTLVGLLLFAVQCGDNKRDDPTGPGPGPGPIPGDPLPTLYAIVPASGPATGGAPVVRIFGDNLSISGTDQTIITSVTLAGVPVMDLLPTVGTCPVDLDGDTVGDLICPAEVVSGTEFITVLPGSVGTAIGSPVVGDVVVQNRSGGIGTIPDGWTYTPVSGDPPVGTTILPDSGPAEGGTFVQIEGARLDEVTDVRFLGVQATIVEQDYFYLVVLTGPFSGAATTTGNVVITSASGSDTLTGAWTYLVGGVGPDVPDATFVTPPRVSASGGMIVTITGRNLDGVDTVVFIDPSNPATAADITVTRLDGSEIAVLVPRFEKDFAGNQISGALVVSGPAGTDPTPLLFFYVRVLTDAICTGVTPANGGEGDQLTVVGNDLGDANPLTPLGGEDERVLAHVFFAGDEIDVADLTFVDRDGDTRADEVRFDAPRYCADIGVQIELQNDLGDQLTDCDLGFDYDPVLALDPATGPNPSPNRGTTAGGQTITLTGCGMDIAARSNTVNFSCPSGDVELTNRVANADGTSMTATTPVAPGGAAVEEVCDVVATGSGQTDTLDDAWTYTTDFCDNDGDTVASTDPLCGGTDCDDNDPSNYPGNTETCTDDQDNDCDTFADEADADCSIAGPNPCSNMLDDDGDTVIDEGDENCSLGGPGNSCGNAQDDDGDGCTDGDDLDCGGTETSCVDTVDNDCDTLVDIADPDCGICDADGDTFPSDDPACGGTDCDDSNTAIPTPDEIGLCNDGVDNDCDVLTDEADPDCSILGPTPCSNGRDDDGDTLADEADQDCSAGGPGCANGVDDDGDGCTDNFDVDCGGTETACNDTIDNDCDGLIDFPADPDCAAICDVDGDTVANAGCGGLDCDDNDPSNYDGNTENCTDGQDNDCDVFVDEADVDCSILGATPCSNNVDDDGDTLIDEGDEDCSLGGPGTSCGNTLDDDGDGCIDAVDADCGGVEANCVDTLDDDCDGLVDAADPDCGACDVDGDTQISDAAACGGTDCDDTNPLVFLGAVEDCFDLVDTDCDTLVEEADLDCGGGCSNMVDDDVDGLTDEGDQDCSQGGPSCANGLDDDADGCFDGADIDCGGVEAACANTIDDDCDTLTDAADPDCGGVCDNDGDTFLNFACAGTDCDDTNAAINPGVTESIANGNCNDGIDNNCDLFIDEAQSGCSLLGFTPCSNGIDDDGDTTVDEGDQNCSTTGNPGPPSCGNLADDDGDTCTDGIDTDCGGIETNCADTLDDDCDTLVDLADPDCGVCDFDGDTYPSDAPACLGNDCDDTNPAVNPGAAEVCNNGLDDECDLFTDEADADCSLSGPTPCSNNLDDDGDTVTDEGDPDCSIGGPGCANGADDDGDTCIDAADADCGAIETNCLDTIDNDCDGAIDIADPDCGGVCDADGDTFLSTAVGCGGTDCDDSDPTVFPGAVENCLDGVDTDCDTFVDENDTDCGTCSNETDDDGDTLGDGEDPDCFGAPECSDGGDNDGDTLIDEADPGCFSNGCTDGIDNDGDTFTDENQPGCGTCSNETDDDGDTLGDGEDPDCLGAPECFDGVDNDVDFTIDEGDAGCFTNGCLDGLDNDSNGFADEAEPQCCFALYGPFDPSCPTPCSDYRDSDGDTLVDEGDPDCSFVGPPCSNTVDDDLDTCVDGADADCGGTEAICDDVIDDDCDTLVDAADPDCTALCDVDGDTFLSTAVGCGGTDCDDTNPAVNPGAVEVCGNGLDDDCNLFTDESDPACSVSGPTPCSNGFDDDGDTLIDEGDPDCSAGGIGCSNNIDDDGDTLTDEADPDCGGGPTPCSNGLDEDGDTLIDCADPDCLAVPAELNCTNSLDDDCDGWPDEADGDCNTGGVGGACSDGFDDDGDTLTDCADPDCCTRPVACPPGFPPC